MSESDALAGSAMGDEILKLLIERASCRNFADKAVPPQVLEKVLLAGVHAATGGNLQPYSVIQVQEQASRERLAELCGQNFMARAAGWIAVSLGQFYKIGDRVQLGGGAGSLAARGGKGGR